MTLDIIFKLSVVVTLILLALGNYYNRKELDSYRAMLDILRFRIELMEFLQALRIKKEWEEKKREEGFIPVCLILAEKLE